MAAEETVHSKLGASSYERWGSCPGSVKLLEGVEKTTSKYADEGSLAHAYAAQYLLSGAWKTGLATGLEEEMKTAIEVYTDEVGRLRLMDPDFEAVEQKFDLSNYFPLLFGTGDYVCYFKKTKTLYVLDYKHGAGVPVNVFKNKQLMYYGVGALHENKFPIEKIMLGIIQPRAFHKDGPIRYYESSPIETLDYIADLIEDAQRTELPDAPLVTGEHCRWCDAKGICPAKKKQALIEAQKSFSPEAKYDPSELSKTLLILDQIENWASGVREFAYREAMAGRIPPGFKLVDKRASRKWVSGFHPKDHAEKLGLEESDFYEEKIKSIPQIEKLCGKKYEVILDQFTVKESSGQNLVPDYDDRPPIDKLKEMFEEEVKTINALTT